MHRFFFNIYRLLVPKPVRSVLVKKSLHKKILAYFSSLQEAEVNTEHKEVLDYLRNNDIRIFPYDFYLNYSPDDIDVIYDPEKKMRYVLQDGKRLYFKKRWPEKRIKRHFCDLLRDQDLNSPHRYLMDPFNTEKDDVVADIGAAEGNFSLAIIDNVKKIYLFENDKEWIEALRATFAPWPEKVEIVNKAVYDRNDASHVRFDTFFEENKDISFLKIDVDGAESVVISSCINVFSSGNRLKIALCTYHKHNDEKEFTSLLKDYGFNVTHSRGYMINYYDKKMKAPYLRRGVIRAVR